MRFAAFVAVLLLTTPASAADAPREGWVDRTLSPDQRADLLNAALTTEEKLTLVHGLMPLPAMTSEPIPQDAVPSAGYVPGIARLGIPPLRESDAGLGVAWVDGLRHDGATAMPSGLSLAASFNPTLAYKHGATIGQEAARMGFNVLLAGGVNLARDPRNGRNFEYLGEDPLLAGTVDGAIIRGVQDQHVISTLKHFALNDQETGRNILNARISEAGLRESDLLAFEIALEGGHPGSVMCAYNRLNGPYTCENKALLSDTLKGDWHYPGWVMSDWGAVHSLGAALAGLDQESGEQLDDQVYFGSPLKLAVYSDPAYAARLSDMTRRLLRSMFAVGVFDNLAQKIPLDLKADGDVAQNLAEAGMVLLANKHQTLPLSPTVKSIAVIGGHADLGVISGGGSSQVAPPGGPALAIPQGSEAFWDIKFTSALYQPSSPYRALQGALPKSQIHFDSGAYISSAVAQAKRSQVAIVFATQWMGESRDAADISLPNGQDALIAAVAKANPHTIVVLETGGPVLMPWRDKVAAVVEAWYPGARGGEALARVLTGAVNPSGRLPVSFPNSLNELPRRRLPGAMVPAGQGFAVDYSEGADVGYRWFSRRHKPVLFPFGYGLSYTRFTYSHLVVRGNMTASMSVTNVGKQRGLATPQIYVTGGPELRAERLIGWGQVALNPGESGIVTVTLDKRLLAHWVTKAHNWHIGAGVYRIKAGDSAATLSDGVTIRLTDETLPP